MKIKQIAEWIKTTMQQKLDCYKNYDYEVIKDSENKYYIKVFNTSSANVITRSALLYIEDVLDVAENGMPCLIDCFVQSANGRTEYIIVIYKK